MPVFNMQNIQRNSKDVMRRFFSSGAGKRFGRKEYKEVQAVANPFGSTPCYAQFNAFMACYSASPDDASSKCEADLAALDECIQAAPTKRRGTLLFHLGHIIGSGGRTREAPSWRD